MLTLKSLNLCLIEADISIGTKRTPQQDAKSNNVSQDGEEHEIIYLD